MMPEHAPPPADDDLAWRETYVVFFPRDARPTLTQVERAVGEAGRRLRVENLEADDDGLFRSVLVQAPDDNAVLDVRYEEGEAVAERALALAKKLRRELDDAQRETLVGADAWLEVMHFERVAAEDEWAASEGDEEFGGPGGLDPATLISVMEALAALTGGLPVDPEGGEVLL